jgi:Predicted transcriptional regulator
MTPAEELKQWRQRLGWTQRQAAEYLGAPLATYKNWEVGHRSPANWSAIRKLMKMAVSSPRP